MNWDSLMHEALDQAQRGRGYVEPNPRVGAIAMRDGRIVGRGFHAVYGGPHAEVVALDDAAANGESADTLVVTLEPCSSPQGVAGKKTPPCTDAIVAAGVETVVIGSADPDPRHHEQATARLSEAGVQVVRGVLEEECRAANRPFARWLQLDVPWVIAKWAMSLDGKTATHSGDSRWISGAASRERVHEVRRHVDAVMVGFRTAVLDDPELTVRHVDGDDPIRVVVDPLAELPTHAKLVATATTTPTWILTGPAADASRLRELRALGVEVIALAATGDTASGGATTGRDLDLPSGLRELRRRGVQRILMEGGAGLCAALFAAGLVHQAMVFLAPKVVGGAAAKTPVAGAGVDLVADAWPFAELCYESSGEDVLVHAFG